MQSNGNEEEYSIEEILNYYTSTIQELEETLFKQGQLINSLYTRIDELEGTSTPIHQNLLEETPEIKHPRDITDLKREVEAMNHRKNQEWSLNRRRTRFN